MAKIVNGIHTYADIGEYRGHKVEMHTADSTFRSSSAGLEGCKTLNEIKRLIDVQEKVPYKPIRGLTIPQYGWQGLGRPVQIVRPAATTTYDKKTQFWVVSASGKRSTEPGSTLAEDTGVNRSRIKEALSMYDQASDLQVKANKILSEIPRIESMEISDES